DELAASPRVDLCARRHKSRCHHAVWRLCADIRVGLTLGRSQTRQQFFWLETAGQGTDDNFSFTWDEKREGDKVITTKDPDHHYALYRTRRQHANALNPGKRALLCAAKSSLTASVSLGYALHRLLADLAGAAQGCLEAILGFSPTTVSALTTWTPRAVAELIEGLGGAVVATHSQSGVIGMHTVRVLKEHGTLNLLKGLIQDEGSCAMTGGGLALTAADFVNIPYLAFKGDYSATSAQCQTTVDAIKLAGGKADYIQLDQAGWWQGSYAGPFGPDYVGPFAGVSHMHMIESNPSPTGQATNLQVMDVMLKWADMNISKPKTQACSEGNDDKIPPGLDKKPGDLPPGQAKK